ncbi:MAG: hypothetical protein Q8K45_01945 [Rubrivivax sp.]|nr:hypothetical protein [Rubrivivax sp.]
MSSCLPAQAAPTTPDTPDAGQPVDSSERGLPDRLRAGDAQAGSRTIDLLIDMQPRSASTQPGAAQRPPGAETKARASVAPAASSTPAVLGPAPAVARVQLPPVTPSGLFGAGAAPPAPSTRGAMPDQPMSAGPDTRPQRQPGAPSSSAAPRPRWLQWPREVIQYVRENRAFVLGSVFAGMLLIWAGSRLLARAAANAGHVPARLRAQGARAEQFSGGRREAARQEARPARQRSRRHLQ